MSDNTLSNKRIAKNTIFLYMRMLLLLAVSLFTSRVVLAALGIDDYGIYNVVGGIVTMFMFLNSAMGNSSHRYIAFALGKGDNQQLKDVVGMTCLIHWAIAVLILILAETVGLWFLKNKMIIPEDRMVAAQWVYQFSVIACMVTVISVPYNALIIAHEKMGAFAFISLLDAFLKLIIAYLIQITRKDKLIVYAALILSIGIIDRIIYQFYCRSHFEEAKGIRIRKVSQMKDMVSFAGWSMIGNLAYIGYTQGLNILLNLFFGPAVNAARGVAVQVQGVVKGFVSNFQTAVSPQIIKSYASEDYSRLHSLIYSSSKFSFYLLYCIALPIAIEAETILDFWLKDVPDCAVVFTILTLLILLVEPLSNPIGKANQATGRIRTYQIVEGGSLLLIVPIAYVILKLGGRPYSVFLVQLVVMYIVQLLRLYIVCHRINMSKREYFRLVLYKVLVVAIVSAVLPLTLYFVLPKSIASFFLVEFMSVISVLICAYYLGLTQTEKVIVISKARKIRSQVFRRT